ncbi:hypothetical protein DFP72DRAFT_302546 [Ephemerocybe angulata]|uniref:Uncharacterized protein n=1 Tax=Ephemerocybe angulata TaxID=980116 RepID=A0A8H6M7H3_9AGAR|nr:hypothetical protein DFP72DRAFT_302546 [Tulosesus angulatus]
MATPSPLYSRLFSLAQAHATPKDLQQIIAIRAPDAVHAWGHNYLISRNPGLRDRMDNEEFHAHITSTGRYLDSGDSKVHEIVVDEHQRKATIHMSYFLVPKGSKETVENNLIWTLKFTDAEDVEKVLIQESVEFIDATASARLGTCDPRVARGVE